MKLLLAMCYLLKWQLAGRAAEGRKAAREDAGRAIPSRQRGRKSPSERQNWFVARVCSMGRGDTLSSGASLASVAAVRCLQAGKTKNTKLVPSQLMQMQRSFGLPGPGALLSSLLITC